MITYGIAASQTPGPVGSVREHGVAPHRRDADLDVGMRLRRVAARARRPEGLDALLEDRGVLGFDGVQDLPVGALEEQRVGVLPVLGTPLEPELERLAEL